MKTRWWKEEKREQVEEPTKVGDQDKMQEENLSKEEGYNMLKMIKNLKNQVAWLTEEASMENYNPLGRMDEALAPILLFEDYSKGWRRPKLSIYNRKFGPKDHLHGFTTDMEDVTTRDDIWCRIFRRTFREEAIGWYQGLPKGSIKSFHELRTTFRKAYEHQLKRRKGHNQTLLNMRTKP